MTPLCGFCCRRDAVELDEDRVPICAACRDEYVPEPRHRQHSPIYRLLGAIARDPGLSRDELAERLGIETPRVSEMLSRLQSRGLIRFEGRRRTRTYFAIAERSHNHQTAA